MCRSVFSSIDGDRSPAGALMYLNNFLALFSGEMPCKSKSWPFNDLYEAGVDPAMVGHTNLNRSLGNARINRAALFVSDERPRS